jgi:hypothetical protein
MLLTFWRQQTARLPGAVVQLVRIPACHAGGRGFESRPLRQMRLKAQQFKPLLGGFFVGVYFACRVSGVLGIALAIGSTDSTENLA